MKLMYIHNTIFIVGASSLFFEMDAGGGNMRQCQWCGKAKHGAKWPDTKDISPEDVLAAEEHATEASMWSRRGEAARDPRVYAFMERIISDPVASAASPSMALLDEAAEKGGGAQLAALTTTLGALHDEQQELLGVTWEAQEAHDKVAHLQSLLAEAQQDAENKQVKHDAAMQDILRRMKEHQQTVDKEYAIETARADDAEAEVLTLQEIVLSMPDTSEGASSAELQAAQAELRQAKQAAAAEYKALRQKQLADAAQQDKMLERERATTIKVLSENEKLRGALEKKDRELKAAHARLLASRQQQQPQQQATPGGASMYTPVSPPARSESNLTPTPTLGVNPSGRREQPDQTVGSSEEDKYLQVLGKSGTIEQILVKPNTVYPQFARGGKLVGMHQTDSKGNRVEEDHQFDVAFVYQEDLFNTNKWILKMDAVTKDLWAQLGEEAPLRKAEALLRAHQKWEHCGHPITATKEQVKQRSREGAHLRDLVKLQWQLTRLRAACEYGDMLFWEDKSFRQWVLEVDTEAEKEGDRLAACMRPWDSKWLDKQKKKLDRLHKVPKDSSPAIKPQLPTPRMACFYCNKPGHMQRECRKRMADERAGAFTPGQGQQQQAGLGGAGFGGGRGGGGGARFGGRGGRGGRFW